MRTLADSVYSTQPKQKTKHQHATFDFSLLHTPAITISITACQNTQDTQQQQMTSDM